MSELKEHIFCDIDEVFPRGYCGPLPSHEARPYYLKSEADKVIADKDKTIAGLNDKLQNVSELLKETRGWLIESQKMHKRCADNATKQLRHHKYKRCLAMAKWCRSRACFYDTMREGSLYWAWKSDRAYKWYKRWFKIADKFKEAK